MLWSKLDFSFNIINSVLIVKLQGTDDDCDKIQRQIQK